MYVLRRPERSKWGSRFRSRPSVARSMEKKRVEVVKKGRGREGAGRAV